MGLEKYSMEIKNIYSKLYKLEGKDYCDELTEYEKQLSLIAHSLEEDITNLLKKMVEDSIYTHKE